MRRLTPATRVRIRRIARSARNALFNGLLVWILGVLLNVTSQNARMEAALASLKEQNGGLYRAADASRDMADVAREIAGLSTRLADHDKRLQAIEHARPVVAAAGRAQ